MPEVYLLYRYIWHVGEGIAPPQSACFSLDCTLLAHYASGSSATSVTFTFCVPSPPAVQHSTGHVHVQKLFSGRKIRDTVSPRTSGDQQLLLLLMGLEWGLMA